MSNEQQINFQEIKEHVTFAHLFRFFDLTHLLEHEGEELTTPCPLCKQKGFTVNFSTNKFSCKNCKKRGSVIDFVSAFKGVGLRESGLILNQLLKQLPLKDHREKSSQAQPQSPPTDAKAPASKLELEELLSTLKEQTAKLQNLITAAENIFAKLNPPPPRRTAKRGQ